MSIENRRLVDPEAVDEAVRIAEGENLVLRESVAEARVTAERMVGWVFATMAGDVTAIGIIVGTGTDVGHVAVACMVVGTVLVATTAARLIAFVAGMPRPLAIPSGPRLELIVDSLRNEQWNRSQLRWALLLSLQEGIKRHRRDRARSDRVLATAFLVWVAGASLLLLGIGFIVGGPI